MTVTQAIVDRSARPSWLVKVLALALMLAVTLVCAEIAASAFYYFFVTSKFDAARADAAHYYRASDDALLAYELIPGFQVRRDNRDLIINSLGLRGSDVAALKPGMRIAVLGDSVTFGIGLGEAGTIPRLMQVGLSRECDKPVEVVNLGVPGYGAQELVELLRRKAPSLSPDAVVYLMNLNDFARRDTLYEGADAGLYRMYHPPMLKFPLLLQKFVYRLMKGSQADSMSPSPNWYRWMINGTMDRTLDDVASMSAWSSSHGIRFLVSILPSGVSLSGGTNALANEQRAIVEGLRQRHVAVFDDVSPFQASAGLFDETDHLTARGNEVAAVQLSRSLTSAFPEFAAGEGCRSVRR